MKLMKVISKELYDQLVQAEQSTETKNSASLSSASRRLDTEKILTSFNNKQRSKACKLFSYLKDDKDFDWNDVGEIILRGKRVPFSHIIDLLCLASKPNGCATAKNFENIPGKYEFLEFVQSKNCPKEFFSNFFRSNLANNLKKNISTKIEMKEPAWSDTDVDECENDYDDEIVNGSKVYDDWIVYENSKLTV